VVLTDEQEFVREAAQDALGRVSSLERIREALDGGSTDDLWPTAVEAGWSGLLVDEGSDGAGLGPPEAILVMAELGRTLAEVPLLGHLVATGLLARCSPGDSELLAELARGDRRAAAVLGADGVELDGDRASGTAEWVIDAEGADLIVIAGPSGAAVAETSQDGVSIEGFDRFDPSLNVANVSFDGAEVRAVGGDAAASEWAELLAQLLLAAQLTGTGRAALEIAVDYAKERHAFARPIGSFQAIKHGLVEVLRRLELAEVLQRDAASIAAGEEGSLKTTALAARAAADGAVDIATRTCMSVHGGIGVTWEHDAPLYFRRAQLGRRLLGGSDRVADELAGALLETAP
jgi:alkylation response protein AidB-like acyl-CoA dehydrogenase